jgi:uncharacterized OB-fold protein
MEGKNPISRRDTMGEKESLVISSGEAKQPFNYAVGLYGSKFFQELRDNRRIMGIKCPECGKVYIPPRKVCGPCFVEMNEFVEVGPKGQIGTFTILRYAFIDPETGEQKPVPYGYGFIKFDGADTLFQHYIDIPEVVACLCLSWKVPCFECLKCLKFEVPKVVVRLRRLGFTAWSFFYT